MSFPANYLEIMRLQEEGRALIAEWSSEKNDLSEDDPRISEIDQKIKEIRKGILELEELLDADKSENSSRNYAPTTSGCTSAIFWFFSTTSE
ncbi:MAG: hypothetical protein JSR37_09815 [Verrucomicrobia bacterium]|nr:hypothetical protein [Verrucomicrobiota bacterium]MBS0637864.1 hypothetical protein [Verrucomicrobiota bacterium]